MEEEKLGKHAEAFMLALQNVDQAIARLESAYGGLLQAVRNWAADAQVELEEEAGRAGTGAENPPSQPS